ncbi:MAG: hypothetical protein AB7G75_29325 [Candidatus Binatia bacterium]
MASEFGRGFKFGVGFALGIGMVLFFLLFGVSMCAGHLHRRMFEQMQEMLPKEQLPPQKTDEEPHIRSQLSFSSEAQRVSRAHSFAANCLM